MGLTQSINIATQALSAMQTAMTAVSNNVANVSTEGYHKLRTNFAETVNYTPLSQDAVSIANSLSGVQVANIERYSNFYLQTYSWNESSECSYLDKYASLATSIEDLVNELDGTGLSKSISDFYTAVDALNDEPSDLTARQNYISAAENLCASFNNVGKNVQSLQQSTNGTIASVYPSDMSDDIKDINSLLQQIADVNESILKTNSDNISSSSLLDKRDALVTELTELINVEVTQTEKNTVNISLGNTALVGGINCNYQLAGSNSLSPSGDVVTTISIEDMDGNVIVNDANSLIKTGSIAAILDATGTDPNKLNFSNIRSFLNNLASEFAGTMNTIQTGDPKGDGTTPLCISFAADGTKKLVPVDTDEKMFVNNDGTNGPITAMNISVNNYFSSEPYNVATARLDISTLTPEQYEKAIGNNNNATIMVESRSGKHVAFDGSSFESYLSSSVSRVGYQIEDITDRLETQQTVVAGIKTKLASETGVNLDEELGDMLKYQQAYKAATRVFNVCNDLIDVLLNMGT